ncbi:MAG: hypothetical protein FWE02_04170, partial [Defluviitaleaceae bacterium]|nr:hypothetical protein [Defluviitaleaceae bacterium]
MEKIKRREIMTYHDNEFKFVLNTDSENKFAGGNYKIKEFYVTPGQDPKNHVEEGTIINLKLEGKMSNQLVGSVNLGRKDSSDTADWFMGKIPANQTTFNHSAGKLNFAFIGDLRLDMILPSGSPVSITVEDVGIAQGHKGASNNWWFGGKHMKNVGGDYVIYFGFIEDGQSFRLDFRRGGASMSTNANIIHLDVKITSWLGLLPNELRLNQIMMPGSHDAGMSEIHHSTLPGVVDDYAKTQKLSIYKQLDCGARYFDIRIDDDHNKLVTYHRS